MLTVVAAMDGSATTSERKHTSGSSRAFVGIGRRRSSRSCRSAALLCCRSRPRTVGVAVARYYDPATAQFLTRDPLDAKIRAAYGYAGNDPVNAADPTGLDCGIWSPQDCLGDAANAVGGAINSAAQTAVHATLDVVATVPYGVYIINYEAAHGVNWIGDKFGAPGRFLSHAVDIAFVPGQVIGLGGDAAIDWLKGHTVNNEKVCDEGVRGYLNPLHQFLSGPLKGPQAYLPGIHPNGDVDFEW